MNRQESTNATTHYKMYKSGRKWVFAGITALTMLTATGAVAHADDQPVKAETQVTSAVPNSTSTANSSAAVNSDSSTNSSSAVVSSATADHSAAADATVSSGGR